MLGLIYSLVFVVGLALGSFLNVVISRLESGQSLIFSRSHCPHCQQVLQWFELIPLLSFILQQGRCRYCRKKISWQYPLVELATGLLFLTLFYYWLNQLTAFSSLELIKLAYWLVIFSLWLMIFVFDLKYYLIPDKIIYPGLVIVLSFNLYFHLDSSFLFYLLSGLLPALFFGGLIVFSQGQWLGWGDLKLIFLIGFFLGWPEILLVLALASVLGAGIGLFLILLGRKSLKSVVPFAPFLILAGLAVFLWGQFILDWFYSRF